MINVVLNNNNGVMSTHGVDADGMEIDETEVNETVLRLYKNDDEEDDGKRTVALFRGTWVSAIATFPVPRSVPSVDGLRSVQTQVA